MTLNQLRYFCTASRCHSITKAAEELYVTQPTVSVAVLKNVGGFIIKLLAFFSKDQPVSLSIEKADTEFNFQVADSNGHSGLSNV